MANGGFIQIWTFWAAKNVWNWRLEIRARGLKVLKGEFTGAVWIQNLLFSGKDKETFFKNVFYLKVQSHMKMCS